MTKIAKGFKEPYTHLRPACIVQSAQECAKAYGNKPEFNSSRHSGINLHKPAIPA